MPTHPSIRGGMNLLDVLILVRSFGGRVEPIRRTGEVRLLHSKIPSSGPINARRKDAPRHAVVWLRRLAQLHVEHLPEA